MTGPRQARDRTGDRHSGIPPTAQIIRDQDGWYLRWQDGDLYWVTTDLEATDEAAALEEARNWIIQSGLANA